VGAEVGHDLGNAADRVADAGGNGFSRSLGRCGTKRPGATARTRGPAQLSDDPFAFVAGATGASNVVVELGVG
jgi:hypothetical protein